MELYKTIGELKVSYLICFKTKVLMTLKKFSRGIISKWTGHYVPMYWN